MQVNITVELELQICLWILDINPFALGIPSPNK